jgi:hypothetical protein
VLSDEKLKEVREVEGAWAVAIIVKNSTIHLRDLSVCVRLDFDTLILWIRGIIGVRLT